VLVIGGLLMLCVGVYGLLDDTATGPLGVPALVAGAAAIAVGLRIGSRRTGRTRYRPDPWALPEWLVTGCGVLATAAVQVDVHLNPAEFFLAGVTDVPPVPTLACVGILIGALPAFLAPPPPLPVGSPPAARSSDELEPTEVAR
jgi:energy-coupling factor transport system permease protein